MIIKLKVRVSQQHCTVTRTIIVLAKDIAINVITEGVKDSEQWGFLLENACEEIQGCFYSHPIGAE